MPNVRPTSTLHINYLMIGEILLHNTPAASYKAKFPSKYLIFNSYTDYTVKGNDPLERAT